MIFGYEVSRTWVSNLVRSDFVYHPLGQPQAQKGVGKWSPEALACTVLMPQPWILGKLFNILDLCYNIMYWHFLIPTSGLTSGAKRSWKMEAWGPGMHSFDASTLSFGEVVQHTSPLNKHYWHYLIPPSGAASDSRRCWKIEAWRPQFCCLNHVHVFWGSCSTYTHYGL